MDCFEEVVTKHIIYRHIESKNAVASEIDYYLNNKNILRHDNGQARKDTFLCLINLATKSLSASGSGINAEHLFSV